MWYMVCSESTWKKNPSLGNITWWNDGMLRCFHQEWKKNKQKNPDLLHKSYLLVNFCGELCAANHHQCRSVKSVFFSAFLQVFWKSTKCIPIHLSPCIHSSWLINVCFFSQLKILNSAPSIHFLNHSIWYQPSINVSIQFLFFHTWNHWTSNKILFWYELQINQIIYHKVVRTWSILHLRNDHGWDCTVLLSITCQCNQVHIFQNTNSESQSQWPTRCFPPSTPEVTRFLCSPHTTQIVEIHRKLGKVGQESHWGKTSGTTPHHQKDQREQQVASSTQRSVATCIQSCKSFPGDMYAAEASTSCQ